MRRIVLAVVVLALLPAPALASDASTAWMTNPQHNGELTDSPLRPPLAVRWDIRLGTVTSNVLVADGRVIFVRADATGAPQLTALDAATGAHLWSVVTPAARIAYDGGRVFATQGTGVAAFSARHRRAAVDARSRGRLRRPARRRRRRDGLRARRRAGVEGGRAARERRRRAVDVAVAVLGRQLRRRWMPSASTSGFGGGQTYALSRATGRCSGTTTPATRAAAERRPCCTAAACTRRRGRSRCSIRPRAR